MGLSVTEVDFSVTDESSSADSASDTFVLSDAEVSSVFFPSTEVLGVRSEGGVL